mmetsp:Transcript_84559/g.182276  ORF Transcript_84559/g.182276 Transcript_84559/m.182276 type:complete len:272 (+) Transcript_84559:292-1107(+)
MPRRSQRRTHPSAEAVRSRQPRTLIDRIWPLGPNAEGAEVCAGSSCRMSQSFQEPSTPPLTSCTGTSASSKATQLTPSAGGKPRTISVLTIFGFAFMEAWCSRRVGPPVVMSQTRTKPSSQPAHTRRCWRSRHRSATAAPLPSSTAAPSRAWARRTASQLSDQIRRQPSSPAVTACAIGAALATAVTAPLWAPSTLRFSSPVFVQSTQLPSEPPVTTPVEPRDAEDTPENRLQELGVDVQARHCRLGASRPRPGLSVQIMADPPLVPAQKE